MGQLIITRHAQSVWNVQNRFSGWSDVPLTAYGREEGAAAGVAIRESGLAIDRAFVSTLSRAQDTLALILEADSARRVPVEMAWELNERHYGALQGMNKEQVAQRWGAQQVHKWRRGYADRPPQLDPDDPRHPRHDALYAGISAAQRINGESLADTRVRVVAYWERGIAPRLKAGETVLLVAHGNTLRTLAMHLESLDVDAVEALEIPTAQPLVYRFDEALRVMDKQALQRAAVRRGGRHAA